MYVCMYVCMSSLFFINNYIRKCIINQQKPKDIHKYEKKEIISLKVSAIEY
jgi:hypothetical protein